MQTPSSQRHSGAFNIGEALTRAGAHWNAGQADQAEILCQHVLAAWPGQPDALHLLGLMAYSYGNLDLAIQHLRQACLSPRVPAPYLSDLAEMCRQRGRLGEAEEMARRAVGLDASLVAAWNNLGIILQEAGKLEESLTCLEAVTSLRPDYAEAHNNLANTYKRLGRLDRAEVHYGEAISRKPDYAEAHSNLANLLMDRGRLDEAVEAARQAIELNPQLADAYINLAAIATTRHQHDTAIRWLDSLLGFAPLHAGALSAKAQALRQMERFEEALQTARRAVDRTPESAEAVNTLGLILQAMGRTEEAMAAYERAAQLPGLAAESALCNRALLLMETGRAEDAHLEFARARQAFPRSARILHNQSDLKTYTAHDPDIGLMETLLSDGAAQSLPDRMALHFALGKAYLDCADGDRAFPHLHEGNRLKRATLTYDPERTSQWIAEIRNRVTATVIDKMSKAGDPSDRPIFVVGVPRSGTTLIEQILASHPDIYGAGELQVLQRIIDGVVGYPGEIATLIPEAVAALGAAYLAATAELGKGQKHVVDKMPANFLHLGLIRMLLPNARIIHVRRDPIDTCLSCYTKLFAAEQMFAYDLNELGRFHRDYQSLMAHWRTVLPADRFIEIDYESVIEDVQGQARRMIDFLGLPWTEACLRFHESRRTVRTASLNQVRQPIYTSSRGRGRTYQRHLGPLLAELGVETV